MNAAAPDAIGDDGRDTIPDVVVVGAGIAGLCAADELVRAGRRVLVLEKSRGVGGRMATRRVGEAVCDHGAQFFTVRGRAFGGIVTDAASAGSVAVWCHGFGTDEGSEPADGHPRWRGVRGMTDLPKRLAAVVAAADGPGRCDIRVATRVASVAAEPGPGRRVIVTLEPEAGAAVERITCRGAILTTPVPQALDLLRAGRVPLETAAGRSLATIDYDPCFALMLALARPSRVPPPGGIRFADDAPGPVAWIADNAQKGISPVPSLTIHATGRFSREHFETPADEVARILLDHAAAWIDGDPAVAVTASSLQRWKFALPTTILPEPVVAVMHEPPIACCGDACAGPRVEGAASSGLAAGRWLDRVLDAPAGGAP
jgi:renalase